MRASNHSAYAFPKGKPRVLEQRERRADVLAMDRDERKKCRIRSGGQCEVIMVAFKPEASALLQIRCKRSAAENHHLLGGNGRRNIGPSILSKHRLDICVHHHREMNVLIEPYVQDEAQLAATVRFIKVQR